MLQCKPYRVLARCLCVVALLSQQLKASGQETYKPLYFVVAHFTAGNQILAILTLNPGKPLEDQIDFLKENGITMDQSTLTQLYPVDPINTSTDAEIDFINVNCLTLHEQLYCASYALEAMLEHKRAGVQLVMGEKPENNTFVATPGSMNPGQRLAGNTGFDGGDPPPFPYGYGVSGTMDVDASNLVVMEYLVNHYFVKAFEPIIRLISDRMHPITESAGDTLCHNEKPGIDQPCYLWGGDSLKERFSIFNNAFGRQSPCVQDLVNSNQIVTLYPVFMVTGDKQEELSCYDLQGKICSHCKQGVTACQFVLLSGDRLYHKGCYQLCHHQATSIAPFLEEKFRTYSASFYLGFFEYVRLAIPRYEEIGRALGLNDQEIRVAGSCCGGMKLKYMMDVLIKQFQREHGTPLTLGIIFDKLFASGLNDIAVQLRDQFKEHWQLNKVAKRFTEADYPKNEKFAGPILLQFASVIRHYNVRSLSSALRVNLEYVFEDYANKCESIRMAAILETFVKFFELKSGFYPQVGHVYERLVAEGQQDLAEMLLREAKKPFMRAEASAQKHQGMLDSDHQ